MEGLPRPWIAGTVIDAASDEVLADAAITALDLVDDASVTVRSDAFGDFWVRGMAPDRKYRVAIGKAGYEAFLAIVTTTGDQDLGCVELKRTR
ncbi:MAG: carboxypeptidase-like regulatory domain-containing protein [Burkholderiales bacterium]|nr:carboxypeptidase-like regulatory domain-containing protein [Burkholderiales bacterium]